MLSGSVEFLFGWDKLNLLFMIFKGRDSSGLIAVSVLTSNTRSFTDFPFDGGFARAAQERECCERV